MELELQGHHAIFEGRIQGIVARFFENERPLQGVAGQLDWHFHGMISRYIRNGAIHGKEGEVVYIPAQKNGKTYHIILVGGGTTSEPGERSQPSAETYNKIKKNIIGLKLSEIGISKKDFGDHDSTSLSKNLKGLSVCIVK